METHPLDFSETPSFDPEVEAVWRHVLEGGHKHKLAFLPGAPRCLTCDIPLTGLTGKVVELTTGYHQSRKHPQLCNVCDDVLPLGGAEVEMAVVFADLREIGRAHV